MLAASAGPTMAGQSAMSWADAAPWLRNAGLVTAGSKAPIGLEQKFRRSVLPCGASAVISATCLQSRMRGDLLLWYDRHRRSMPWRARPGEAADPYRVWLSEIMLQQTTVAAVGPYYDRFLLRFPSLQTLAAAPTEAVMEAWAGLGYYARARNLHACAKAVAALGAFPRDVAGLRALPGIGAYTAAAVASIAFGVPVVPVDGNVERVVSRLFGIETPLPQAKVAIAAASARLGDDPEARRRPPDFTQALFDLGATICTPRNPACALCPWRPACVACAGGQPDRLPVKPPRRVRPLRYGGRSSGWRTRRARCCFADDLPRDCWVACSNCPALPGGSSPGP